MEAWRHGEGLDGHRRLRLVSPPFLTSIGFLLGPQNVLDAVHGRVHTSLYISYLLTVVEV